MLDKLKRIFDTARAFTIRVDGVAAVEFALILPLLLTLYLGSVELSSAISVDKRISTVSGSLGDLVARSDGSISTSTLDDYFLAASATMAPYDSTGVRQVVSCLKIDSKGVATVAWSRGYNGGKAHTTGAAYTVPDDFKTLALNGYVIVSEAEVLYKPLFGYFFNSAFDLYRQLFYLPRFGGNIQLT